jgi:protein gp37
MGEDTKIQWCDHTFSAWIGCQRVSPGCEHCYAEQATPTRVARAGGLELWGPKGSRRITSDANWRLPIRWNKAALAEGVRRRVFCSSLSDVFEDRPELEAPRERLWSLIVATPGLDWLILTKRPENADRMARRACSRHEDHVWPSNVWLGTTCEDQRRADERILHLMEVPAKVRFLSVEPMLGPVDLRHVASRDHHVDGTVRTWDALAPSITPSTIDSPRRIDWVIVGGESGSKARPCEVAWVRSIVLQCRDTGVACFLKQLGARASVDGESVRSAWDDDVGGWEWRAGRFAHDKAGDPLEWPEHFRVREFPRGAP